MIPYGAAFPKVGREACMADATALAAAYSHRMPRHRVRIAQDAPEAFGNTWGRGLRTDCQETAQNSGVSSGVSWFWDSMRLSARRCKSEPSRNPHKH
jgi:hypothetical protein